MNLCERGGIHHSSNRSASGNRNLAANQPGLTLNELVQSRPMHIASANILLEFLVQCYEVMEIHSINNERSVF